MYIKLPSKHRSPDLATAMKYSVPIPLLKPRPSTQQHLLPLMRQDSSFAYKNTKCQKKRITAPSFNMKNHCTFLQQEKTTAPSYSKKTLLHLPTARKITAPYYNNNITAPSQNFTTAQKTL
jgi:hypothetical protein